MLLMINNDNTVRYMNQTIVFMARLKFLFSFWTMNLIIIYRRAIFLVMMSNVVLQLLPSLKYKNKKNNFFVVIFCRVKPFFVLVLILEHIIMVVTPLYCFANL